MTLRTWNTIMELCGMALGLGVVALILWTILFAGGCGSVSRVPVGDSGSDEDTQDDLEVGEDGLEALLPDTGCDGVLGSLECNAADGWYPAPECGVEAEYLHCFWYSTPYTYGCYPHPATWAGTVACR